MRKLVVNSKYNGKKLNTVLLSEFDGLTTSSLYKALRKKDIRINGVKTNQNATVYEGDEITIFITDEYLFKASIITKDSIIYEDENILVANKPAGIEVAGDNSFGSLLSGFLGYNVFPCHRLDRNTSGLVLFAKNETALNILFDKFKNHEIEKHYICEVYGIPKEKHKILTDFLFKDNKKAIVYISNVPKKGYVKIITEYTVLSSNKSANTSKLEVILHTGRTHQIRAHLAYYGYPILGDGKYGNNEINKKFKMKKQELTSYSLKFNFTSPSGILEYLSGMEIHL